MAFFGQVKGVCFHSCYFSAAEVGKEGKRVTILVSSHVAIVTIITNMFLCFFSNASIMLSQVALHLACRVQHACDPDSGKLGVSIRIVSGIASLQVLNGLPLSNFPSTHNDRHSIGNVEADRRIELPTYFSNLHLQQQS